jgi:hypothetical protein
LTAAAVAAAAAAAAFDLPLLLRMLHIMTLTVKEYETHQLLHAQRFFHNDTCQQCGKDEFWFGQ